MSGNLAFLPDGTIVGRPDNLDPRSSVYFEALATSARADADRAERVARGSGAVVISILRPAPGDIWATFGLPGAYSAFEVDFLESCRPSTGGGELVMQGSVDGSTFLGGASDYRSGGIALGASSGTVTTLNNYLATSGYLSPSQAHDSGGMIGRVFLDPRRTATAQPQAISQFGGSLTGGAVQPFVSHHTTTMLTATAPLAAVRFAWVARNWSQGLIILRGIVA